MWELTKNIGLLDSCMSKPLLNYLNWKIPILVYFLKINFRNTSSDTKRRHLIQEMYCPLLIYILTFEKGKLFHLIGDFLNLLEMSKWNELLLFFKWTVIVCQLKACAQYITSSGSIQLNRLIVNMIKASCEIMNYTDVVKMPVSIRQDKFGFLQENRGKFTGIFFLFALWAQLLITVVIFVISPLLICWFWTWIQAKLVLS